MKRFFLYLFGFSLVLAACKNNKKTAQEKAAEKLKDNIESMAEDMAANKNDIMKGKNELEKLAPLSIAELKTLIPETLMGAKRTSYNASSAMGAGLVRADYRIDDTTKISLNIYDCAGPAGAGIYSMQYLGMMNMESESEDEYTKTINYGDGKAYEHCQKTRNDCTLTWFAGGRYLVTLDGDNVPADALKSAGKELKF
jgi:hypothetical protein